MIRQQDDVNQLLKIKRKLPEGRQVGGRRYEEFSETPLMTAIYRNRINIFRTLLAAGADTNKANEDGHTPLMISIKYGFYDFIPELLNGVNPASVMHTDSAGYSVLTFAAKSNNFEVVSKLVAKRPNLNLHDANEGTPLHYAVRRSNVSLCKLLLDKGANPSKTNNKGESSRAMASRFGDRDVIAEIGKWDRKHKAKVPARTPVVGESSSLTRTPRKRARRPSQHSSPEDI